MLPRDRTRHAEVAPAVSVVIPTFRRPALLETVLSALASQIGALSAENASTGVEVIVVDNCPEASATEVCVRASAAIPRFSHVHMPRPGVVHARNAGVEATSGHHVIFLDDDEIPGSGWLRSWLDLSATGVDAAFGPVVPRYGVDPAENRELLERMFARKFAAPTGTDITRHMIRLGTGNSMFRRTRLNGACTFDVRFNQTGGEDLHMIRHQTEAGVRLIWNREAAVDEVLPADRMTVSYLKSQRFNRAQLRCLLILRAGGMLAWPRVAIWMLVGLAQTVLSGTRYLLADAARRPRRQIFAVDMQGGLGKVFWYRGKGASFYARATSEGQL